MTDPSLISLISELNPWIASAVTTLFGGVVQNLSSGAVTSLSLKMGKQVRDWALGKQITPEELQEKIKRYNQENKRGFSLFEVHIRQACLDLAREMEREKSIPETDVRYPLLCLLGDSAFHRAITVWLLTVDPEKKQACKKALLDTLKDQCAAFDTAPATLQKLSETMDQIQGEIYNDPILSSWSQGYQMDYLVESTSIIKKDVVVIKEGVATLQEGLDKHRGKHSTDVLDTALRTYYDTVSPQFETISDATARNELPLLLDEFFMPLSLQIEEEGGEGSTKAPVPLEKLDWTSSPWLILGNAGDGKSTTFRWLVHTAFRDWKQRQDCESSGLPVSYQETMIRNMMFQGKLLIPILCRDMYMEGDVTIDSILAHNINKKKWVDDDEYEDTNVRNSPLYKAIKREIKEGRAVFLIDGLDELKERAWQEHDHQTQYGNLLEELVGNTRHYKNNSLVVSSRPFVLQLMSDDLRQKYRTGHLVPPKKDDKIAMITHWVDKMYSDAAHHSEDERTRHKETLINAVAEGSSIGDLTDSPLMLSMLLIAFKSDGKIPTTERELYEKAVSELIFRHEETHFQPYSKRDKALKNKEVRKREILAQLEYLAVEMWIKNIQRLDVGDVVKMLGDFRDQLQKITCKEKLNSNHDIEDLLLYLQQNSGLFFPVATVANNGQEETWWEFRHLAFQDYLAACAIYHGHYIRDGKSLPLVAFVKEILFDSSEKFVRTRQHSPKKIISLVQSFYPDREEKNEILASVDNLFVSVFYEIFDDLIPQWEGSAEELVADFHKKACAACARALVNETGEEVIAVLRKGMDNKNDHVRYACAHSLANKRGEDVTATLLKGLDDKNGDVRVACAFSLANKEGDDVTAALLKGMDDKNGDVRAACAHSLADKREVDVSATLLKGLDDKNSDVRAACASSLANRKGEHVVTALLKSLDNSEVHVRNATLYSLSRTGVDAVTAFLKGMDDEDAYVRCYCATSLANKEGDDVTAALLKGMDDKNGDVRAACAHSLANKRGEDVTATLFKGLGDVNVFVRAACAYSLANETWQDITAVLLKGLGHDDCDVRDACIDALAKKTGAHITAALLQGLHDDEIKIKIGCARSLAYKEGSDVINALTQLAKENSDFQIREICLESLDTIKKRTE